MNNYFPDLPIAASDWIFTLKNSLKAKRTCYITKSATTVPHNYYSIERIISLSIFLEPNKNESLFALAFLDVALDMILQKVYFSRMWLFFFFFFDDNYVVRISLYNSDYTDFLQNSTSSKFIFLKFLFPTCSIG